MTLLSLYKDNDDGNSPNVHNLSKERLAKRKIVKLDIVNDEYVPYSPMLIFQIDSHRVKIIRMILVHIRVN
jgi:hypothetical protein